MPLPTPMPTGPINTRLRDLQRSVESLKPQRSAGILTSHTTRGVFRRPVRRAGTGGAAKTTARWA